MFCVGIYCFRWKSGQGGSISSSFQYWDEGQPNVQEFDYEKRRYSPISDKAYQECGENPDFDCFTVAADAAKQCSPDCVNQQKPILRPHTVTRTVPAGAELSLFVDFELIKSSTADASPACMAMYGPTLTTGLSDGHIPKDFNLCDFAFGGDYGRWVDLKCNQRTRAQFCIVNGNDLN